MNSEKIILRKQYQKIRQQLPLSTISGGICSQIQQQSWYQSAIHLFLYAAMAEEVNLFSLMDVKSANGGKSLEKIWYLPRVKRTGEASPPSHPRMVFHRCDPEDIKNNRLIQHPYGMLEPPPERPVFEITSAGCIDVIFLPGLAFSKEGMRLGYGKGFYDEFLTAIHPYFQGILVGVVPDALLVETLPVDPWDYPVDSLVSESQVINLNDKSLRTGPLKG
ncbi:MAG: 5-formyltetrahydrofolate cyclo-ligase [Cyanobacteria bacterium]|nr:5-formyltetrahydrofolate cyclo-ligase [Cyanobacteriota bacterium]